jgi:1-acyl-sn-glycerol-3-phosphate acyltransferase
MVNGVWQAIWVTTYPWAKLLLGLSVIGRDRFVDGAQIIASNHVSNVDPVIMSWAAARELHFLAKQELFDASRWFDWLIRSLNAWPVRRGLADRTAIKHCSFLLRHRQTLVLFPEGTRSRTGELAGFRPGFGMLAVKNRVPVIPTRILGLDKSWLSWKVDLDFARRGWRRKPKHRSPVTVAFGEPVWPQEFPRGRDGYVAMTKAVEERVRALGR